MQTLLSRWGFDRVPQASACSSCSLRTLDIALRSTLIWLFAASLGSVLRTEVYDSLRGTLFRESLESRIKATTSSELLLFKQRVSFKRFGIRCKLLFVRSLQKNLANTLWAFYNLLPARC